MDVKKNGTAAQELSDEEVEQVAGGWNLDLDQNFSIIEDTQRTIKE